MNKEIGSYDAKTRLPEILRRVSGGESFTVTNRGKPIADIKPCKDSRHVDVRAAITGLLDNIKAPLSDQDLLTYKNEGRK